MLREHGESLTGTFAADVNTFLPLRDTLRAKDLWCPVCIVPGEFGARYSPESRIVETSVQVPFMCGLAP
jgi:hypothetical protein